VKATRQSPAYSPIATNMHIPSSSAAMMLIHHPMPTTSPRARAAHSTATINVAKRPVVLNACRSDDTPVISNIVVDPLEPDRSVGETSDLEEELADDSRSSSNDDITVSRINVSDTDLLRSESPGCLRNHRCGAWRLEMQNDAEAPSPAPVIPQAFTAGRMRHVHPRRPRPGDPKTPVVRPSPSMNNSSCSLSERRSSYNDGRDLHSLSSRVLAPCPEDCSTTFTPSPTSSPQHRPPRRGGGLLSSLRGRRCGADESDASSVTPLCDPDKLVSRLSALAVSDPPPAAPLRRRFFGGLVGMVVGGDDSQDGKPGRKDKKGGNGSLSSSNKSTASQRYLEQVSAQEAKERQKMTEERERRRIEQKRRAYLQQQRAKEMASKRAAADEEDAMTRPSSSRTAATVQSSLFDEDSHLFGSRVSSRSRSGSSAMRSQSAKSKATTISDSSRRESSGMFREFGEFLFSESCPATVEGGSVASSTAMTTAPNTRTNDGTSSVHDASNHQNALLPPCVMCHSAERTHVATPCFHFLYCQKCAKKLPSCVACHQPAKFRPISM
jgi:Zinc finger, C3HC4 type (RING finger)